MGRSAGGGQGSGGKGFLGAGDSEKRDTSRSGDISEYLLLYWLEGGLESGNSGGGGGHGDGKFGPTRR